MCRIPDLKSCEVIGFPMHEIRRSQNWADSSADSILKLALNYRSNEQSRHNMAAKRATNGHLCASVARYHPALRSPGRRVMYFTTILQSILFLATIFSPIEDGAKSRGTSSSRSLAFYKSHRLLAVIQVFAVQIQCFFIAGSD